MDLVIEKINFYKSNFSEFKIRNRCIEFEKYREETYTPKEKYDYTLKMHNNLVHR